MSGGSMDYLYAKVRDAPFAASTPERRAFRKHLALVAKALRMIEWVESGDADPDPEENQLIAACLGDAQILEQHIVDARAALAALTAALERAEERLT